MWSAAATKLLISIRGTRNSNFEKTKKNGQKVLLWQAISNEMKENNYNFSAKHCDEKWRRLLTRYRQVRDTSKRSGSGGIKWQFYNIIHDALSPLTKQAISPPKSKVKYLKKNGLFLIILVNSILKFFYFFFYLVLKYFNNCVL